MRQRVNRMHYSFYDTFGDSALNARPYSLYEANPPKISSWTESAGLNIGGPLKIPHVYDGTDKTFFYINFGGIGREARWTNLPPCQRWRRETATLARTTPCFITRCRTRPAREV